MSLQDSLYSEDVEYDVTTFAKYKTRKRVLVFPPVDNYRRYIIHQVVQDRFSDLRTFSIGQGSARRTVVCYKSDVRSDWQPKSSTEGRKGSPATERKPNTIITQRKMGVERQRSPSTSSERKQLQRQAKSTVEIYRPPAARRASNCSQTNETPIQSATDSSSSIRHTRHRRPDRAVYVPKHRRSLEVDEKKPQNLKACLTHALNVDASMNNITKLQGTRTRCSPENVNGCSDFSATSAGCDTDATEACNQAIATSPSVALKDAISLNSEEMIDTSDDVEYTRKPSKSRKRIGKSKRNVALLSAGEKETVAVDDGNENETRMETTGANLSRSSDKAETDDSLTRVETALRPTTQENRSSMGHEERNDARDEDGRPTVVGQSVTPPDVLIISDGEKMLNGVESESKPAEYAPPVHGVGPTPHERKVKKFERQKSKPVPPPSPPVKMIRDECDWDSLFDDNGDCLDPTLIEELTSAVGEVTVEQPKNDYKAHSKQIEVSSDEFAHVVEIYNFPSEFKTSDLAAVFSTFKNGGFELKWVDDTHCLGVFSSPLVAAEVLASDHPFVKTRPLSEATALSKTKARRSAEFLQPYRNRPETCAALARRLVTGALGVKLATARQEREHEKNILREAKEKRRLANKQREDVWEGIIPTK